MAKVGVGVIGNDGEKDDDGQPEEIAGVDCDVERGILVDAHGALHPVDDAFRTSPGWQIPAKVDAVVVSEFREGFGMIGLGHSRRERASGPCPQRKGMGGAPSRAPNKPGPRL